jgi:hypothetical protein
MEESNNSDIYDALVKISQGREVSNWELQRMDDIVDNIKFNSSSPGKSRIKLIFNNNEDYWKLFDLTRNEIWFANQLYSYYDTFEFESSDWVNDDWKQGYILREFDTNNLEKVRDILKLIAPKYYKLANDDDFEKASVLLENMFERQIDEIKWSYTSERNRCKERGAIAMIESDTCKAFENYGIFSVGTCFYSYITNVSILLSIYKNYGNPSMTLYQLLEKIGKDLSIGGDWYEYMHEQDCIDFDIESFNRDVSWELDKIMDKITDDEDFVDVKNSVEKLSDILDKYNVDEWYNLPKDPKVTFKILDINLKEENVIIALHKKNGTEKRSYSFEDFNTFLYQHELFEHRKFGGLK